MAHGAGLGAVMVEPFESLNLLERDTEQERDLVRRGVANDGAE